MGFTNLLGFGPQCSEEFGLPGRYLASRKSVSCFGSTRKYECAGYRGTMLAVIGRLDGEDCTVGIGEAFTWSTTAL